jgi:hypothetical protein
MSTTNGNLPYHFAVIALKQMVVDAYQRPLTNFVEEIEQNFDPALVGTLCVSQRSKARFAVIDGQTRAEAMRRLDLKDAPCIVYTNLTVADEARLFARFQTQRRGMSSSTRFVAEVIAGDAVALEIDEITRGAGFRIGVARMEGDENLNEIKAVAALEFIYRGTQRRGSAGGRGNPALLADALTVLRGAWPTLPATAKSATILRGLGWYLARDMSGDIRESEVDLDRLVERLGRITPSTLAKRADALREGRGMTGKSPSYMAEAIEAQMRRKIGGEQL